MSDPESAIPTELSKDRFITIFVNKDGGMSYEIHHANAPDKVGTVLRALGTVQVVLWQLVEWLTMTVRMSQEVEAIKLREFEEALMRLPDDGPPN